MHVESKISEMTHTHTQQSVFLSIAFVLAESGEIDGRQLANKCVNAII